MNLLFISSPFVPTPPPTYGGTQRDVAVIGEELAKVGHNVTIIASKKSRVPGCKIIETTDWNSGETFSNVKSNKPKINNQFWDMVIAHLKSNPHYDIVNSHAWLPGMPYQKIKSLCKRLCISIHGGGAAEQNSIFVSQAHRDAYKKNARYVHNPIASDKYEYKSQKQQYLSFLARLDNAKGVDIAINVSKKTGIPLKIGGNISDQSFFNRVIKPNLNGHIQYIGQVGGKEKSDLLGNSLAVLYPTRLKPEPFGRVPLEANACGTPAIAFNNGGLKEVVKHGETGFLVNNEQEMADAVAKVSSIRPETCRKWVEENFNPRLIAERYLELYQELMEGKTWG